MGTSVSAVFLLALGMMNVYILWKLYVQLKKVITLQPEEATSEGLKFEGGGCLFRSLKRLFRLIDRPWRCIPLGVLFGLGFDTSSEVALLGISGVEGSKGTDLVDHVVSVIVHCGHVFDRYDGWSFDDVVVCGAHEVRRVLGRKGQGAKGIRSRLWRRQARKASPWQSIRTSLCTYKLGSL